ncbi:unnamed protein product [Acanthoscelides obtectus]|uniref:Uncharacterized protein n=1 Tax=Acanthoscelides obtectus TaxID=200917 RepID=A0A9P0KJ68_ACAOB|nr:unnamed protein product [Acanthoscelides obtectus]CAK1656928.1 hypothetical protein AOBTE_LOCUS20023 [Acanthoscelides obtectus]
MIVLRNSPWSKPSRATLVLMFVLFGFGNETATCSFIFRASFFTRLMEDRLTPVAAETRSCT